MNNKDLKEIEYLLLNALSSKTVIYHFFLYIEKIIEFHVIFGRKFILDFLISSEDFLSKKFVLGTANEKKIEEFLEVNQTFTKLIPDFEYSIIHNKLHYSLNFYNYIQITKDLTSFKQIRSELKEDIENIEEEIRYIDDIMNRIQNFIDNCKKCPECNELGILECVECKKKFCIKHFIENSKYCKKCAINKLNLNSYE